VFTRQEDVVLPQRQEVHFLNRLQRYETNVQAAERSTRDATDTVSLKLSLVLAETHARAIAETKLSDQWAERSGLSLQLPMAYAALKPGDVLTLTDGAIAHRMRVRRVQIGRPGMVNIRGVIDAAEGWDGYIAPTIGSADNLVLPSPKTRLEILDIPALPGDTQDVMKLRFAACGIAQGWKGATLVRVMTSGDDEQLLSTDSAATIGSAVNALGIGGSQLFDEISSVDIALLGEAMLANASERSVLDGANVAVLGDEIIQFRNATQLGPNLYRLSGLLRGRLGTEAAIVGHAVGERFVLLDDAVKSLSIPASSIGQGWTIRAVSFGDALSVGLDSTFTIQGEALKPLSVVHARAIKNASSGDITLSWIRRTRIDSGMRDFVDVPLMEQSELYDVVVMNGANEVRNWQVSAPSVVYNAANQTADFGSAPSSLTVKITQRSGLIGPEKTLTTTLAVQ